MRKVIDAVSLIMTHNEEIFCIKRQNFLRAFPGYHAFPGGKVDRDESTKPFEQELLAKFEPILMRALVREAKEELNIELDQMVKAGDVKDINLLGCAITPDFNPYRFATYFFKVELNSKPNFIVDTNEAAWHGWKSSKELLHEYNRGEIMAVPPIIHTIEELGKDINLKELPHLNFEFDGKTEVPMIENIKGVRQLMPLSHTLPPASRTNCFLIGDEDAGTFIIDPSPEDEAELEKLINTLPQQEYAGIFLSHHHPDHHENSVLMAEKLSLPVHISQDTYSRIKKKWGENYFRDVGIQLREDGEILTQYLGENLKIYALPGHDEGQLGLAPDSMKWFFVGDLFQGIGTVVVGGDEGDMTKYMQSLEKVIALNPKAVIPSHGIALGGTNILEKTLEHRKMREEQVKELKEMGKSLDEMFDHIYGKLDERLKPLALLNIKAHLDKLENEN